MPFTKYPANPPSIGNSATIGRRTVLFFVMIAISILAAVAAARIRRLVLPPFGPWNSALLAGATFLATIAVAQLILPAVHETPAGFPADVLWRFRVASLGINATLWSALGLIFGALAQRLVTSTAADPTDVTTRA